MNIIYDKKYLIIPNYLYTTYILNFIIYKSNFLKVRTNINIRDSYNSFKYMIEYNSCDEYFITDDLSYYHSYIPHTNQNCINFLDKYSNLIHKGNVWINESDKGSFEYLPVGCDCRSIENIKDIWDDNYEYIDSQISNCCEPIDDVDKIWDKVNNPHFDTTPIDKCCDNCEPIPMFGVKNIWNGKEYIYDDVKQPLKYKIGKLRLYFPQFSVDTYNRGVKYALTVNTWIHGYRVVLGSYLINRLDAIAAETIIRDYCNNYYEYVEFNIIDPWSMIFDDEWDGFRKYVCKEAQKTNSVGSVLNFSLYPIIENDGKYVMIDGYQGGQNSINISKGSNDYLNLSISTNLNEKIDNWKPSVKCEVKFNNSYIDNLKEYLEETYNINANNTEISYELVIKNSEDIYMFLEGKSESNIYEFTELQIDGESLTWLWWDEYHKNHTENLTLHAIANIGVKREDQFETILYIKSNELPLTQEVFSYFINNSEIKHVNLNDIKMNLINIDCVNKTENKIYQFDKPEDSKSNIIQPVFFKARDAVNIIVHPAVTENICINLDQFKSKVKTFIIQIEGCPFTEIGRTPAGVIFKIVGKKLPNKITEGVYYILNENSELVTDGKYTYDS